MQIIPQLIFEKIQREKYLHKFITDIDYKAECILTSSPPYFFADYTDHGVRHFADTIKMAQHLIYISDEKLNVEGDVVEDLTPLNYFVLMSAILFHDLGMHIHFEGFKQLINGFFDDVRVSFFDDYTWKEEWDNYIIEAKRFSGKQRMNIFGDEQIVIPEIDFTKPTLETESHKNLIGEFLRRHHGRLAHEIALKGFPIKNTQIENFAEDLKEEYKDIIGLIARSHSLNVRDSMAYVADRFPADIYFPYEIEIPYLMCVLRIADYFQFSNTRTNVFLIKLKSFTSPFSKKEHESHLSTEYFKTDEKDPETLFVDLKPLDGLMYAKLLKLFNEIQAELDTSFAVIGEMYGRHKTYLKLKYRRIKTSLNNRQVISKLPFVVGEFSFEADNDLFKLLVGPLYGYNPSYGVRELIQNAVDSCIELRYKHPINYQPSININVKKTYEKYLFSISDNGKGMSINEIKNYFLKAGASFRNSTEWKIEYQSEDNTPAIRRTGKFGIGVLASFLIGSSINVTTRRYNELTGYAFQANLNNDFIEIKKIKNVAVGTTIEIVMDEKTYTQFIEDHKLLTQWYILTNPPVNYHIEGSLIQNTEPEVIKVIDNIQTLEDSQIVEYPGFESIIWRYQKKEYYHYKRKSNRRYIAINGIVIPDKYYYPTVHNYYEERKKGVNIYDELSEFPFISIFDKNNLIDLELSRNSVRGHLPFIKELIESCQFDFLYKLLFFDCPVKDGVLDISKCSKPYSNEEYRISLDTQQFVSDTIYTTNKGYFLNTTFYNPIYKDYSHYKIFNKTNNRTFKLLDDSIYSIVRFVGNSGERSILRGDYKDYVTLTKPEVYEKNYSSNTITKWVRDSIKVVKQTKDYIILQRGELLFKDDQIKIMYDNDVQAVQLMDKSLSGYESINTLLKKHFLKPALIPFNLDEKLAFAKTMSEEFKSYIEKRRGHKL